MRLKKIHLRGYRILDKFTLALKGEVKSQYALDLLVGVNGTGKSTLLHALAEIFQNIYAEQTKIRFGFFLQYRLATIDKDIIVSNLVQGEKIDIKELVIEQHNLQNQTGTVRLWVDDVEQTGFEGKPTGVVETAYLPRWVIISTSGSEKGWQIVLPEVNQDEQTEKIPRDKEQLINWYLGERVGKPLMVGQPAAMQKMIDERFLFVREELLPLVVLCGFLQDMAQYNNAQRLFPEGRKPHPDFLANALSECKLAGLHGFSLKLRLNRELLPGVADHFAFLTELAGKAHHIVQRGADYLFVFALDRSTNGTSGEASGITRPEAFFSLSMSGLLFFQKLVNLQQAASDAPARLLEINLFFASHRRPPAVAPAVDLTEQKKSPQPPLLLFDWLSDGEQSFLGRLCLFALFEAEIKVNKEAPETPALQDKQASVEQVLPNDEALILLDEPEVHFNDYWKRQLVRMLTKALRGTPRHVLMTTHSSITLSDVAEANIWVLQREDSHTRFATTPNIQTLGADPSDILIQVFGAENAVGAQSVDYILQTIKDAREQWFKEKDHQQSQKTLQALLAELGPGYWRFLVRQELEYLTSMQEKGLQG